MVELLLAVIGALLIAFGLGTEHWLIATALSVIGSVILMVAVERARDM